MPSNPGLVPSSTAILALQITEQKTRGIDTPAGIVFSL